MDSQRLSQKVAQHFNRHAAGYAGNYTNGSFFSYFFNQRLEIVFDTLKNYKNAKICDLGCGPGVMVDPCVKMGFEFWGVDISEKMICECTNKFGHLESAHFSVGKLQTLEFPDAFFDVVVCMGALEYLDEDEVEDALTEMKRILKPGGEMVISLMNKKSFFYWHRRMSNSIKSSIKRLIGRNIIDETESHDGLTGAFDKKIFCSSINSKNLKVTDSIFYGLNIYPYFLEERISTQLRIKSSRVLYNIFKGKLEFLYMAFIIKAIK
jgi:ubiquinone/menaquinone biosynthesis C-methylase UbiE